MLIPATLRGAAVVLWIVCCSTIVSAAERTNVLFIAIDDLNDWIGCLDGHPQSVTPNLDRLAARSVMFTNAHCDAPACNPSRAALMTGIRPATSGIYHNSQRWRASGVLADAVTLAQHFRHQGYTALGSGKIYHGSFPDPASWDSYWPSQEKNRPVDPLPTDRPLNGIPRTAHFDWGPLQVSDEQMGDWQVADWVIDRLQAEHEKPFFLACGFFRPHLPWYVPQKYFDGLPSESIVLPHVPDDDLDDVPAAGIRMAKPHRDHTNVLAHNQWKHAVRAYLASICFVDVCLGRVLDALESSPFAGNTIVVLWSDHGWHLGEKKHWRKFALWEEATQVVMMWSVPGITSPGQRCDAPVNLLDVYPTLIDLCQLTPNSRLEGVSLRPLLEDVNSPRDRPALTTFGQHNHAIRSHRYRYIRYEDGSEELYDHSADEMEWRNRAADPRLAEVKAELATWLPAVNATPNPALAR